MRKRSQLAAAAGFGALLALGGTAVAAQVAEPAPNGEDELKLNQCLEAVRKAESDARACIGVVADPCLEQPGEANTMGIVACMDRETLLWDRLMRARFGDLVRRVTEAAGDQVRDVQEAWVTYRDKRCTLGQTLFAGGSMASVWGAECMLEETGRRAIEISTLADEVNAR